MSTLPALSYADRLRYGVARWMQDQGIGEHDLDSPFMEPELPIYYGPDIKPNPDRAVFLTVVGETYDRLDVVTSIQFRFRSEPDGDPDELGALAYSLSMAFAPNGFPLVHTRFGGVRISKVLPQNSSLFGRDSQRRVEHVSTFRFFGRRNGQ